MKLEHRRHWRTTTKCEKLEIYFVSDKQRPEGIFYSLLTYKNEKKSIYSIVKRTNRATSNIFRNRIPLRPDVGDNIVHKFILDKLAGTARISFCAAF